MEAISSKGNWQIVSKLAKDKVIERLIPYSKGRPFSGTSEDLAQDLYMELLGKDPEKLKQLYETGEIRPYLVRSLQLQFKDNRNKYYKKYGRFANTRTEFPYVQDEIEKLEQLLYEREEYTM